MLILLWNSWNTLLLINHFSFAIADQCSGDERLAWHSADVWAAELEGGSGCCHDVCPAWGVLFSLWSVVGYRRCSPYCFQINPVSQKVLWSCVFQTFLGADWRQQKTPSCEPRPACVTSALETSKNWCLVGAECRMDTVPCPFRQVYILIPALCL